MQRGNCFSLQSLMNHVTNQVIMADTDMQLQQGKAWQDLTKNIPLAAGSSHLKFLGLDEIEFSFCLSEKKPNLMNRVLIRTKLKRQAEVKVFKITQANESVYNLKIRVTRSANKQFKMDADTNIPNSINRDKIDLICEY